MTSDDGVASYVPRGACLVDLYCHKMSVLLFLPLNLILLGDLPSTDTKTVGVAAPQYRCPGLSFLGNAVSKRNFLSNADSRQLRYQVTTDVFMTSL